MKILHIINSLATGGAEKLVADSVPLFRKRGLVCDVLVFDGTSHPFHQQLSDIIGAGLFNLGTSSVYNPIHIIGIIPHLQKYDVVHVHLFPAQYFVALAKFISLNKIPLVFTEHNTSNKRIQNRLFKLPEKAVYAAYDKIICITEEVEKVLINHVKLSSDKIIVIENGIDFVAIRRAVPKSLNVEFSKQIKPDDFILLMAAGFREQKDHMTLLKSLARLPKNVKLFLAGDGRTRIACEKYVHIMELEDRVYFLGIRSDVHSLYKSCDIGILSSKWEGFGLSAVEGMASGKPFIASQVPGLSEVVGGAGVLFPVGDDQKLAEEILKLMNNKDWYNEVARRGMERASNFDINKMVDKTIELYKEILVNKSN